VKTIFEEKVQFIPIYSNSKLGNDKRLSQIDNQIQRENLLSKLNNYILSNGSENPENKDNYAHYLLSYWEEIKIKNNSMLSVLNGSKNIF
jgi:hypothetical protein